MQKVRTGLATVGLLGLLCAGSLFAQSTPDLGATAYQRFRAGDKMGAAQIFGQICDQGIRSGCEDEATATYSAVIDVYATTAGTNINGGTSNCSGLLNLDKKCEAPVAQAVATLEPLCRRAAKRGAPGPKIREVCGSWLQMRKHLALIRDPEGALGFRR